MKGKGTVLVTGATGYIASHVIRELLEKDYKVVGTVRSLGNKEKNAFLKELPKAKQNLELREANLLDSSSWGKALDGVQNVIHVASPVPTETPKDENELIKPAVEGTKNVIDACLEKKVKRLVFTSSCLTAMIRTDGKIVDQNDWSDQTLLSGYPKSKYLAERLFWEQAEKAGKAGHALEFVSILPSLVLGPSLTRHDNSSQSFISEILKGGYPGVPTPSAQQTGVDVRDLAIGYVTTLEAPEAKGKRFLFAGFSLTTEQLFDLLRKKYESQGYKIPSNPIDAQGIKKSGHGPSIQTIPYMGVKMQVDNSRSVKELGMAYRGAEETVIDHADKLIELGVVKNQ